jgi:hypothetical protein
MLASRTVTRLACVVDPAGRGSRVLGFSVKGGLEGLAFVVVAGRARVITG